MKYAIEAFDKESDLLDYELSLPSGCDARLAKIMDWSTPQRGDEGYDLDATQIAALELLVKTRFYNEDHVFQLTCNPD